MCFELHKTVFITKKRPPEFGGRRSGVRVSPAGVGELVAVADVEFDRHVGEEDLSGHGQITDVPVEGGVGERHVGASDGAVEDDTFVAEVVFDLGGDQVQLVAVLVGAPGVELHAAHAFTGPVDLVVGLGDDLVGGDVSSHHERGSVGLSVIEGLAEDALGHTVAAVDEFDAIAVGDGAVDVELAGLRREQVDAVGVVAVGVATFGGVVAGAVDGAGVGVGIGVAAHEGRDEQRDEREVAHGFSLAAPTPRDGGGEGLGLGPRQIWVGSIRICLRSQSLLGSFNTNG